MPKYSISKPGRAAIYLNSSAVIRIPTSIFVLSLTSPAHAFLRDRPGVSVSLAYHYFALRIANEIEPFHYRLEGDDSVLFMKS
jgi:hypothetical protein